MSAIANGRSRQTAPVAPLAVAASPLIGEKILKSHWSEEEHDTHRPLISTAIPRRHTQKSTLSVRSASSTYSPVSPTTTGRPDTAPPSTASRPSGARTQRPIPAPDPIITISASDNLNTTPSTRSTITDSIRTSYLSCTEPPLDESEYVTVDQSSPADVNGSAVVHHIAKDKASRVLGIKHRKSMEPIPASNRASMASIRSAPAPDVTPAPPSGPTLPLASLYVVSGLPKSPHTWTLADPDSVLGLHHSEGAVSRWWRPEVLGSTVSPGAGGGKKKRKGKSEDTATVFSSSGHLSKQEVGKMLSKALKVRRVLFN